MKNIRLGRWYIVRSDTYNELVKVKKAAPYLVRVVHTDTRTDRYRRVSFRREATAVEARQGESLLLATRIERHCAQLQNAVYKALDSGRVTHDEAATMLAAMMHKHLAPVMPDVATTPPKEST